METHMGREQMIRNDDYLREMKNMVIELANKKQWKIFRSLNFPHDDGN